MEEGFLGNQESSRADNHKVGQKNDESKVQRDIPFYKLSEQIGAPVLALNRSIIPSPVPIKKPPIMALEMEPNSK